MLKNIWDGLGEFEKKFLWSALVSNNEIDSNSDDGYSDEKIEDYIENKLGKILSVEFEIHK